MLKFVNTLKVAFFPKVTFIIMGSIPGGETACKATAIKFVLQIETYSHLLFRIVTTAVVLVGLTTTSGVFDDMVTLNCLSIFALSLS